MRVPALDWTVVDMKKDGKRASLPLRRVIRRLLLVRIFLVSLGVIAILTSGGCSPRTEAPAVTTPAAVAPSRDPQKLNGHWLRYDSDYVIAIDGVSLDGKLDARYLNPKPIHVSRAEWKEEDGRLKLLVEMTDVNYPGSFYTLTYDPGSDTLTGVYYQKLQNQEFEVAFSRLSEGSQSKPSPGP